MLALSNFPAAFLALLCAWSLLPVAHATYLVINAPAKGTQWVNGATNPISWTKGLLDSVSTFDIEMSRMSDDGLIYVARNVDCSLSKGNLNVALQDVPTGDDYYLLFIDSAHGILYGTSPRFSIVAAENATATPTPVSGAATASLSGGANPTVGFATTFAAVSGAVALWGPHAQTQLLAAGAALLACLAGGAWSVL
ncbi:uncharacterized protein BXZ73DRAFT_82634 [Epithele typhae]|uniref:uncharacterized protein n=1 Tax=Epithele typhae TaxID=378194 RepID=UPI002007AE8C|nr:uncharacterized protein BXZ73DRAFT_82634 [Epithele typhae]KAH9911781.1 hypothetical protein BXZ73DRAFT_82634 [Epithele typhae]